VSRFVSYGGAHDPVLAKIKSSVSSFREKRSGFSGSQTVNKYLFSLLDKKREGKAGNPLLFPSQDRLIQLCG